MRPALLKRCFLAVLLLATFPMTPAEAQGVAFRNFHRYPAGQWRTESTAFRNGVQSAPPQPQTTCAGAVDPQTAAMMQDLRNSASNLCSARMLRDEPSTAEYEQICSLGAGRQTIHFTLQAIDDRTVKTVTTSSMPGVGETVVRQTSTYEGTCRQAAAPMPTMSAADCQELAEVRRQFEDGVAQCGSLPDDYRRQCEQRLAIGRTALDAQARLCH